MSLKTLAASGLAKKTDQYRVPYGSLVIEKGFNVRNLKSAEAKEHIHSIYLTIKNGGDVPPLEVRTDDDNNVIIVDGHCRHAAYGMAISDGLPIEYISVLPFKGNDVDRVAKMITSSQGMSLTPLETAHAYKRLEKFNWDEAQISARVGKSIEQVKQLLFLAHANISVQKHVESGSIGAYQAIELLKKHGENTGDFIEQQLDAAQSKGKTKITKAGMEGRALPKKFVTGLVNTVASFAQRLDAGTRKELASLESATEEQLEGRMVQVSATALLDLMRAQQAIDEIKEKQDAKSREKDTKSKQTKLEV
jgi:ParB family chromosome partitioning protein